MRGVRFYVSRANYALSYHLYMRVIRKLPDGIMSIDEAINIQLKTLTPEDVGVERAPLLELEPEAAQNLMDQLYQAGLRPSDTPNTASALAATEHHLNDMRKMVSKLCEVLL